MPVFFLASILFITLFCPLGLQAKEAEPQLALKSTSAFYPPEHENPSLYKKVNFSFQKTRLSEILKILSKVGEFNIMLPEGLDPEINITLKDKQVIDAIKDIIDAAGLKYRFSNNSLVLAEIDISEAEFEHFPVLYAKASEITGILNDELFRQFIISQPEEAFKPYAFTNPGQNTITIVGNHEQLKAAKSLIKKIDIPKHVEFFKPSYISLEDIEQLISAKMEAPVLDMLALKNERGLMIKGAKEEVKAAVKIISDYDMPKKPLNFYFEVLKVDIADDTDYKLEKLKQIFPMDKIQKVSAKMAETPEFTAIADYLFRHFSEVFLMYPAKERQVFDFSFSAERDILEPEKYSIKTADAELKFIEAGDIVGYLTHAKNIVADPLKLKEKLHMQPDDLALVLIQQQ